MASRCQMESPAGQGLCSSRAFRRDADRPDLKLSGFLMKEAGRGPGGGRAQMLLKPEVSVFIEVPI